MPSVQPLYYPATSFTSSLQWHGFIPSSPRRDVPLTGEVEGGHRRAIQKRLKLSGAWWKEENAEKMLALRVIRANDEWQSYWSEARQAAA
jgi:hypothetical protein